MTPTDVRRLTLEESSSICSRVTPVAITAPAPSAAATNCASNSLRSIMEMNGVVAVRVTARCPPRLKVADIVESRAGTSNPAGSERSEAPTSPPPQSL